MIWVRRIVFSLIAVVAASFLVFGAPKTANDVPADFVIVRYWEKWTGNEASQMRQIVDDFNRTVGREKKIHVQYMSMSQIDEKALVSIAAGVPPDIAGLWDPQVVQFAALGALQPLDDLAASHGITADTYLPVYWEGCKYRGKLYALVSTPASIALHYNKLLLQENAERLRAAGLDPTRPPRTIDELGRYSAVLEKRDASKQLERAGYMPLQSWYVPFTVYWFGGELFDASTQRFLLDSPQSIRAYEWIKSYSDRLSTQVVQSFVSSHNVDNFDTPQNPFLTGVLAMQQQGPWMANYVMHLKPSFSQVLVPTAQEKTLPRRTDNFGWGVAPFPSADGRENVAYCSFDSLCIPVGARHPKEAFEFIAYVNRHDVSEKLNTMHCKNTQLRHVSQKFFDAHPNPYIDVFQRLAASPNARGIPPVPIWPEVAKELIDAGQAVALAGADPTATLHAAQQRIQAKYDQFRAIQEQRERQ